MVISAKLQLNERNACCPCIRVSEDEGNKKTSNSLEEPKMEEEKG